MLVLSRRETEKVLFPTLGISVELLRVQGNRARLGKAAAAFHRMGFLSAAG